MTFKELIEKLEVRLEQISVKDYFYAEIVIFSDTEDRQLMEPMIGMYQMSKFSNGANFYFKYSTIIGLDSTSTDDKWICLLTGRVIDKFGNESDMEKGLLLATNTKPLSEWLEQQDTPNVKIGKNKLVKKLVNHNKRYGNVAPMVKKETIATKIRNSF